jgi:hypothetical protein
MKEEDRGQRIATASGGRLQGRRLEFLCFRASRHVSLRDDLPDGGAVLLAASAWRGIYWNGGATSTKATVVFSIVYV